MPSRLRRSVAVTLSLFVIAGLFPMAVAVAEQPSSPRISHPWVTDSLADELAAHPDKIPAEFRERLRWVMPDGTLRVMVALQIRDADAETFIANTTTWKHWYGDAPRFLARVTPAQLTKLLAADVVTFVEPDYPITNFMASSSLDVHARSTTGDGSAVWSFDPTAGPMGALKSDIPSLTADQATGKGVTVAITDSGIDRTHRDFGGWDCQAEPYEPCNSRIIRAVNIDHLFGTGADPSESLPTTEFASGHGTHVAGTIAGNAYYQRDRTKPNASDITTYGGDGYNFGIAPQADLISTKNGDTLWAGLSTAGLQWQLDHADEYGIRVSSNSWGCVGGCSFSGNSAIGQLFKQMYEAGIVVVFAVGNDGGTNNGNNFSGYAQSPYVLGVANYNDTNHRLASSSSRGSDNTLPDPTTWTPQSEPANGERRPDVGAPGTSIWSAGTLTGGAASVVPRQNTNDVTGGGGCCTREYRVMSGTSMATPHVAGAAAVMFSACPTATSLDVMRAVMVGADAAEVLSTDGSRVAQPFETGYGSLEVRRSVDWLLTQRACGGTGGGDPAPDPTTTTDPAPEPTETSTPTEFDATTYYLRGAGRVGNIDAHLAPVTQGHPPFSTEAPTGATSSSWLDVPVLINGTATDPNWLGTLDQRIDQLAVDFYQRSPLGTAVGSIDYDVVVQVGDTRHILPTISKTMDFTITNGAIRVQQTFTHEQVADGPDEGTEPDLIPLSIDPTDAPVRVWIRGHYADSQAVAEIFYNSTTHPSNFTVFTAKSVAPDPTADPTSSPTDPPQAATTSVEFTGASASGVQYSDDALIEATLATDDGQPIAGADLVFELAGANGTRDWTVTTDASGLASQQLNFTDEPGHYDLTVRYVGDEGTYLPDADWTGFVVEPDDSATALSVAGKGNNKHLSATTTDADSHRGLEGLTIEFFVDDRSLGTATTDGAGNAVIDLPARYRYGPHAYEAVFGGNAYYERSSDRRET